MASRSADIARERPFYARHADAYDSLITDPAEPWVEAVHACLVADGTTSADVLDAGCGTGRHARGLIDLGHTVTLLDASPDLLRIARRQCPEAPVQHGDICSSHLTGRFDAIVCRGVPNDLITDDERESAVATFARILRPDGLLLIDVREATQSRRLADGSERRIDAPIADGGRLVFSSSSQWDDHLMRVTERYELHRSDGTVSSAEDYQFAMRPWTTEELEQRLTGAGFTAIDIRAATWRRTPDRLFVRARWGDR